MKTLSMDTSSEAEQALVEGLRKFPAWRKFRRMVEMTELINGLAIAELRRRYPDAADRELKLRLVSRWIEADLMRRAFGWNPEKEGY